MLARCPNCRNTFSTDRVGHQECPACGKPLIVPGPAAPAGQAPAPAPSGQPAGPSAPRSSSAPAGGSPAGTGPDGEAPGTPWERRAGLGLFEAWKQTTVQALFEPTRLFSAARLDRGPAQLGYALLTASLFWAVGQLLGRVLLSGQNAQLQKLILQLQGDRPMHPLMKSLLESQNNNSASVTILLALSTPVMVVVLLYANAAVTHLAALLLGQNKRGFPATFAACAYGLAPAVLAVVPACGSPIAVIWIAVLTGVGLKETHRISSGGAAAAVLAPYLALCCIACAGSVAIALAFGRMATGG